MDRMNELIVSKQYPAEKYNNLVPMQTVTNIAEIHKPVINTVEISINENDKEIYLQDKNKANSDGWALTKKGLTKLMRAAGIKILYTKSELPSVCQKCAEVNRNIGRAINCGACQNKDVKFSCAISVPQLTGDPMVYEASKEIVVEDETANMTAAQKSNFMKFRTEMCESKALNRALRGALNIKSTYSKQELTKPFVVAYLVPNLDNPEVKQAAINSFYAASEGLFGKTPEIEKTEQSEIVAEIENTPAPAIEAQADVVIEPEPEQPQPAPVQQADGELHCDQCGAVIKENVYEYSLNKFGRPLCMKCQKGVH